MPPRNNLLNPMTMTVGGLAEAQAEIQRLAESVSGHGLEANLNLVLLQLQRYALGIVHVDTGRLKNSIFTDMETERGGLVGHVATNVEYAPFEDARGGNHGFFESTAKDEGPRAINNLFDLITAGR